MTNKILGLAILLLIVFKITAVYFTEFSLYGDEAQYWLWSQTLDLGYYSKPVSYTHLTLPTNREV